MSSSIGKLIENAEISRESLRIFSSRQLIYDYPEQLFADKGVMAIEHADFEGVERLAQVLGKQGEFNVKWMSKELL